MKGQKITNEEDLVVKLLLAPSISSENIIYTSVKAEVVETLDTRKKKDYYLKQNQDQNLLEVLIFSMIKRC